MLLMNTFIDSYSWITLVQCCFQFILYSVQILKAQHLPIYIILNDTMFLFC